MNEVRQFRQNKQIVNGITAETNLKMFDIIPGQHENLATNTNEQVKIIIAQTFCEPVAVCSTNNPPNGHYTATCVNFPDFAVSFVDSDSVRHILIGLKLRVVFEHGITYGSVAAGTFPTLSVNESEPLPLLAQGKTMAQGAIVAGQSVEFTIIPYGNSIAFDADSNVRENTSDYTIYTDGSKKYNTSKVDNLLNDKLEANYWTLFSSLAPSAQTVMSTYEKRKFSDYTFLIFLIGSGSINSRNCVVIPSTLFRSGNESVYLYAHGSGMVAEVDITCESDTSINIKQDLNTGNPFTPYIRIYGI